MDYNEVRSTVARGWGAFQHQMKIAGFTDKQVDAFREQLDRKDVYNAVVDAAMEVSR